ncbi:MAG: DUF1570 domain-containing protein [Planctomycetota bacterium]
MKPMTSNHENRARWASRGLSTAIGLVLLGTITPSSAFAQTATPGLIQFNLGGQLRQGLELINLGREAIVIGRDGSLHSIDPTDGQAYLGPVKGDYAPLTAMEMRNELRREFGSAYEVVATKHFLVVQPKGRGKKWPNLFEHSHRAFMRYMQRRGVRVREGRFPMVAVVFPDSRAMYREFHKQGLDVSRVAGVYANNSNRVMTHDGGNYRSAVATIRHEAAHQSGFNSGVHSRVNDTPRWVTEGIGQLFEPAAVGDVRAGSRPRDRVNFDSMRELQRSFGQLNTQKFYQGVRSLVSDDVMFDQETSIGDAYAVAWAMTFYLAEREPKRFARVLNHTASRPAFKAYERAQKVADFEKIVGCSCHEFARKVAAYIAGFQG